jgi:membrane-bound ClpP family serine protease
MTVIHELDRSKGLDLILHTPGGETAATESIVDYLHSMFGTDIRAIIPQLAMSAGTMIACACREIVMGKQSSLGPIDPQLGGLAAHRVVEEFKRVHQEIKADPSRIPIWQPIIAKYHPTLIGECEKAIDWSNEMVWDWLKRVMFKDDNTAEGKVANIVSETLRPCSYQVSCTSSIGGQVLCHRSQGSYDGRGSSISRCCSIDSSRVHTHTRSH